MLLPLLDNCVRMKTTLTDQSYLFSLTKLQPLKLYFIYIILQRKNIKIFHIKHYLRLNSLI